jgi:adenylate cyclase
MLRAIASFNEELTAEDLPTIGMRAGIATDTVIVGDAGASDRSDYTALGDAVNLASRLEGANKMLGTSNLLTQATAEVVNDRFLLRPIGNLQVVGKSNAVMTYEALCPIGDATPQQEELVALTRQMIDAFTQSRFADCIALAGDLEEKFGPHKLTSLYRSLSTLHQSTPPSEPFEGRIILAEK